MDANGSARTLRSKQAVKEQSRDDLFQQPHTTTSLLALREETAAAAVVACCPWGQEGEDPHAEGIRNLAVVAARRISLHSELSRLVSQDSPR
jgi:hypothetical protein